MSVVIKEIETKGVMTNAFLYKKTIFYKFCAALRFEKMLVGELSPNP